MFKNLKLNSAKDRLYEEKLYEQVVSEIQEGNKRPGLWAKAIAQSNGNEELARGKYIELRVQSLKDELIVTHESSLKKNQNMILEEWSALVNKNDQVTKNLITKAKQKNANFDDLSSLCLRVGIKPKGKRGLFKDSWVIENHSGSELKFSDSDDLESFLVNLYEYTS